MTETVYTHILTALDTVEIALQKAYTIEDNVPGKGSLTDSLKNAKRDLQRSFSINVGGIEKPVALHAEPVHLKTPSAQKIEHVVYALSQMKDICDIEVITDYDMQAFHHALQSKKASASVLIAHLANFIGLAKARELAISTATTLQIFQEGSVDLTKISDSDKLREFGAEMQATNKFFCDALVAEVLKITRENLKAENYFSKDPHAEIIFKLKLEPHYGASQMYHQTVTYFKNIKGITKADLAKACTIAVLYKQTPRDFDILELDPSGFTDWQQRGAYNNGQYLMKQGKESMIASILHVISPKELDRVLKYLVSEKEGSKAKAG